MVKKGEREKKQNALSNDWMLDREWESVLINWTRLHWERWAAVCPRDTMISEKWIWQIYQDRHTSVYKLK